MKLSVIVPVYNVEKYLRQCLDSLKSQTLKDMEVIIVNDGSTDSSPQIAGEYCASCRNFMLLSKENGGLSDARNYGIDYAKGDYIAFLDSDDWVEPELYEKMVSMMDEHTDVCVTDIEYWWEDPSRRYVMKGLSSWEAETEQKRALLSPMFAWNKVYKASLFTDENGYRYPVNKWYEDIPVTTLIFAKAEKIAYLPECLIHYRQREGSIMSNTSDPRLGQIFSIMALLRENFEKDEIYEQYRDELEYLHIEHLRLYGMFRFIRSDESKKYYTMSEAVMGTCFPHWRKNRYIRNLSLKNRVFLKYYNRATAWLFDSRIR